MRNYTYVDEIYGAENLTGMRILKLLGENNTEVIMYVFLIIRIINR